MVEMTRDDPRWPEIRRAGRAITIVTQYDVELYQRIEQMIGQRLGEFDAPQDEVLLLLERVSEAQRHASMEMRAADSRGKGKGGGKGKRSAEGEAEDASAEPELQRMIDQQARRKQKKKR